MLRKANEGGYTRFYSVSEAVRLTESPQFTRLTARRVSRWFEWWTEFEKPGDEARPGRPPKLTASEPEQVVEIVAEEPRSIRRAVAEVDRRMKKKLVERRGKTLKRILRAGRQRWKRVRLNAAHHFFLLAPTSADKQGH